MVISISIISASLKLNLWVKLPSYVTYNFLRGVSQQKPPSPSRRLAKHSSFRSSNSYMCCGNPKYVRYPFVIITIIHSSSPPPKHTDFTVHIIIRGRLTATAWLGLVVSSTPWQWTKSEIRVSCGVDNDEWKVLENIFPYQQLYWLTRPDCSGCCSSTVVMWVQEWEK